MCIFVHPLLSRADLRAGAGSWWRQLAAVHFKLALVPAHTARITESPGSTGTATPLRRLLRLAVQAPHAAWVALTLLP